MWLLIDWLNLLTKLNEFTSNEKFNLYWQNIYKIWLKLKHIRCHYLNSNWNVRWYSTLKLWMVGWWVDGVCAWIQFSFFFVFTVSACWNCFIYMYEHQSTVHACLHTFSSGRSHGFSWCCVFSSAHFSSFSIRLEIDMICIQQK